MHMRRLTITTVLAALSTLAAAEPQSLTTQPGVWKMQGYGIVLDATPSSVTTYDVTDISCVRVESKPREQADEDYLVGRAEGDRLVVRDPGGITDYALLKLPTLPDRCRQGAGTSGPLRDPALNFWVLWHAFRENYAFFETHAVDWNLTAAKFRPRIDATTTDAELGAVFNEMLLSLADGHVTLQAGERTYESGRPGELRALWQSTHAEMPKRESRSAMEAELKRFVETELLHGKGKTAALGALTWGWMSRGVAYLQVSSMWLTDAAHPDGLDLPRSLELIDAGMRQALRDLHGAKVWVVDARLNGGGHDAVALRIMGYFTGERFKAFSKKAVDGTGFTDEQPVFVEPATGQPYPGPILYLQSGSTVSAAEIFSLAMQARPNVTRIGTPTYGVFSDELEKHLPNGWTLTLSNELYTSVDGNVYESKGVPPQIPVRPTPGMSFIDRLRLDIDAARAEAAKLE